MAKKKAVKIETHNNYSFSTDDSYVAVSLSVSKVHIYIHQGASSFTFDLEPAEARRLSTNIDKLLYDLGEQK